MKILDWLLEAFGFVYEIFLCSLALSLTAGVILLFADFANSFMDLSLSVKVPLSVAVGICLKLWKDSYLKKI